MPDAGYPSLGNLLVFQADNMELDLTCLAYLTRMTGYQGSWRGRLPHLLRLTALKMRIDLSTFQRQPFQACTHTI